jgi:hypothetical protein
MKDKPGGGKSKTASDVAVGGLSETSVVPNKAEYGRAKYRLR